MIALAVLLVASACLATLPVPASTPPTSSPDLAGTQGVTILTASAPTALPTSTRSIPTPAPSVTMTPFPSITPLPTATATNTATPFGYKDSPTPVPPTIAISPTFQATDSADGATDDWGSDYRCTLTAKTPLNWTVVPPLQKYKVSWTLLNTGHKRWQADQLTIVYVEGIRLRADLPASLMHDVKVGESITPIINIYPPKEPGTYRSVVGMRVIKTGHLFCTFTVQITVKK